MKNILLLVFFILVNQMVLGEQMEQNQPPKYLYKVLSAEDWKASQNRKKIQLSKMDAEFIHLSTEEQLDRILDKYWSTVPEYVVLKLETAKLPGKLVLEANPGGAQKYYHLYNGSIPLSAVVESKSNP